MTNGNFGTEVIANRMFKECSSMPTLEGPAPSLGGALLDDYPDYVCQYPVKLKGEDRSELAETEIRMPKIVINIVVLLSMFLDRAHHGLLITSFPAVTWFTLVGGLADQPSEVHPVHLRTIKLCFLQGHAHRLPQQLYHHHWGTVIQCFWRPSRLRPLTAHFRRLFMPDCAHAGGAHQMTFIPVLRQANKPSLSGTFAGLWLVHTEWFTLFHLYAAQFLQGLPKDL